MKLATEKPGITTPWFLIWYTLHSLKGIASGDGRCCSHREIAYFRVKGFFLADGNTMRLRHFCTHHKEHFLRSKLWVPDWEFFGTGEKSHHSSTLNKLRRELGSENHSQIRSYQDFFTQVTGDWRGSFLRWSAYAI
jgi:hypothetical protein